MKNRAEERFRGRMSFERKHRFHGCFGKAEQLVANLRFVEMIKEVLRHRTHVKTVYTVASVIESIVFGIAST